MSLCGCFSPNPRLGKNNSFQDDAEPPELAFTDKQNRFSQDILTGLRGMSAPTTAVSCARCPALLSTFVGYQYSSLSAILTCKESAMSSKVTITLSSCLSCHPVQHLQVAVSKAADEYSNGGCCTSGPVASYNPLSPQCQSRPATAIAFAKLPQSLLCSTWHSCSCSAGTCNEW